MSLSRYVSTRPYLAVVSRSKVKCSAGFDGRASVWPEGMEESCWVV